MDKTNENKPILSAKDINKWFGDLPVLKGVSLDIAEGEVVVIIGASGSGKSTFLRCINFLEEAQKGTISFRGKKIRKQGRDLNKLRTEIGMVFQHFNLFPHMNVLDNVTLAARKVHGWSRKDADAKAEALLERIGLGAKIKEFPDRLSGGQQQRVAIIRAILTDPQLLLLDEITSALDPQLVGEVLDLVRDLKEAGSTIVMATHEMNFARSVANRVVFLHQGRIVEQGTPDQIFDNPQRPETQAFLERVMSR